MIEVGFHLKNKELNIRSVVVAKVPIVKHKCEV